MLKKLATIFIAAAFGVAIYSPSASACPGADGEQKVAKKDKKDKDKKVAKKDKAKKDKAKKDKANKKENAKSKAKAKEGKKVTRR